VRLFRTFEEAKAHFGPCALAIGNFDGVHIGHRALVREAIECAKKNNLVPAVLTFDPHPTAVVAPTRVPKLICTLDERLERLGKMGVAHIFLLNFNTEVAKQSPEDFVFSILADTLQTKAVFVGDNFRFGHRQSGTPAVFQALGVKYGFTTRFLEPIRFRAKVVSSTQVREDLRKDRVAAAGRLLGRCYSIRGPVVSGRGIGSKQAVPTLNLDPDKALEVPKGIFITETVDLLSGRRWPSVTSCGYNPTFGATPLTVETYLLTELNGESPEVIEVQFRQFLRAEEVFPNAEALKTQILKDVARAEDYWRRIAKRDKSTPSIY
jgi:riboflavin kinase / FMN adenylyltransferase